MPRTTFRVTNNRLPEFARRVQQASNELVEETLSMAETHIKTEMAAAKNGAWYGDHQASAPGEAPAIDSSNLVNSLEVSDVRNGEGSIGTNAEYAEVLEFGGVNMAARPFMIPAGDRVRPSFMRRARDLERRL